MSEIAELLRDRLTIVSGIVGLVVAFNTALTTCSTDTTNRYSAFRTAVAGEETFWKERFAEHAEGNAIADENQRHGKLIALAALSQHPVPKFEEYWLGPFVHSPKNAAENELTSLRQSLINALMNDRDRQIAELVRQSAHFEMTQAAKPQDGASAAAGTQKVQAPEQAPSLETQVLGIGPTQGWDLDVFWCTADTEAGNVENYNYAKKVATVLGGYASGQFKLAPGVMLGRVQLRPLPQLVQGTADYPVRGSGNTLLVDNDAGEQEAATALLTRLTKSDAKFAQAPTTEGSKYYLSAFVCGTPPPATPENVSTTAVSSSSPAIPAQGGANGSAVRPIRGGAVVRRAGELRRKA